MSKILFVIDMQNDFIDGALGTPEAEAIVSRVDAKIRKWDADGNPVIFTADTHGENYENTQEGRKLPVPHCIRGSRGWEISSRIYRPEDAPILEKNTFGSNELGIMLMELSRAGEEIREIQFVGLCTDICVISNALLAKAFLPEAEIIVDSSCCAGVTPQGHETALEAMKACQITVI